MLEEVLHYRRYLEQNVTGKTNDFRVTYPKNYIVLEKNSKKFYWAKKIEVTHTHRSAGDHILHQVLLIIQYHYKKYTL